MSEYLQMAPMTVLTVFRSPYPTVAIAHAAERFHEILDEQMAENVIKLLTEASMIDDEKPQGGTVELCSLDVGELGGEQAIRIGAKYELIHRYDDKAELWYLEVGDFIIEMEEHSLTKLEDTECPDFSCEAGECCSDCECDGSPEAGDDGQPCKHACKHLEAERAAEEGTEAGE